MLEIERRLAVSKQEPIVDLERELHRVRELEESNPMLGTRGCRLGLLFPEIYEVQVRAIVAAAAVMRAARGGRSGARDHDPAGRLCRGAEGNA